jgi:beta-mannosidase
VSYFTDPATCGLDRYCTSSQLAQIMVLRTCIERSRSRWPNCTGVLHYKLNDNFPAISWSTVDWYGAPKLSHFAVRNAHRPLHACILQSRCSIRGANEQVEPWLMDDAGELAGKTWRVGIRLFGSNLEVLQSAEHGGAGAIKSPLRLPTFCVPWKLTEHEPLFVVVDLFAEGVRVDRSWYFFNFEAKRGCLFDRPAAALELKAEPGAAVVANTGSVPALGVMVTRPGHADTFTPDEGFLWLDPGETQRIPVDSTEGLSVEALNAAAGAGRSETGKARRSGPRKRR